MTNDESPDGFQILHALARNLKSGLRGIFYLRLPLHEGDANWTQLMLLLLLSLVVQLAWNFFNVGPGGEFTLFGLPGALFHLPVLLFVAWLLTRLRREPEKILSLVVVFCAIDVPFAILTPMLNWLPGRLTRLFMIQGSYEEFPVMTIWYSLSCGVAAARLLSIGSWWQRVSALLLVALLIALPLTRTYRESSLWALHYDQNEALEDVNRRQVLDREDVFYLQPKLLQQELDGLVPQRHEGINLFFVGVAGYADQDVFLKEIRYVDKLFKDRFGTAGHSILLVNNPETARQLPIASTTSVGLALKKVGDTMDKDKDILFLYLTSHGSRDHKFSLDFGEMKFNDLDPPRLRKLLDESGIKHRVVVVGACYSGGFVDTLKNDDTLVITSAAPDRTSFGCSDEEDFTYFGRAYFADALSSTDSFIDAFTLAKPIVAAREKKDDFTPSDPRIDVGAAIKAPLEAFARQQREARVAKDVANYKLRSDVVAAATSASAPAAFESRDNTVSASSGHERLTPEDERLQMARELVASMQYKAMIQEDVKHCKEYSATKDTPEKVFEKHPDAFQGLTPKSANWPKLVEALQRYWEQSCYSFQGDTYLDVMALVYATSMTKQELADAAKYLASPSGQALTRASLSASKALTREATDQVKITQQKALDEYNKTLADLAAADPKASKAVEANSKPWWHFW